MDFSNDVRTAAEAAGIANGDLQLNQEDTRTILLRIISENPGIWYRELLRMTGVSNGTLTYHLRVLEEAARIKVVRADRVGKTRYYSVAVSDTEMSIISCVHNTTTKRIMVLLIDREFCTFGEIVDHIGKSPSTISWHLKRLVTAQVVSIRHDEMTLYSLVNRDCVIEVLSKYKESLLEAVANNYSDIIEEL